MTDDKRLAEIVARIIDVRREHSRISPAWIATEAMKDLDPGRDAPALVYAGCHLQLRQIARGQLRGRYDPDDQPPDQHELWPHLQARYPSARSHAADEPEYVRLEDLTPEDVRYNVARLRSEADAKQQHADSLEAWSRSRFRRSA